MRDYLIAMGFGAALSFFLDPQLGRRRRHMARDRAMAFARRNYRRFERIRRKIISDTIGKQHWITRSVVPEVMSETDAKLRSRSESEGPTSLAA